MNQQAQRQWTIQAILQWTITYFEAKGIQNPRLTAEVLLAHVLRKERLYLYTHYDQPLEAAERAHFKSLLKQRVQGTPTQYLTGKQEFWSLTFHVAPGVLIPRPETEHLVEAASKLAAQFPKPAIVDIGVGSGAIAISLKKERPQADVYAGDLSDAALTIARQNASRLLNGDNAIIFRRGDLLQPFAGIAFDLIVSNPPYISAAEYAALAREVREHEPKIALYGGAAGLDVYQRLIAAAPAHLQPGGYVLVEIGYGQKDPVVGIFQQHGFIIRQMIKDYAQIDRVIVAQQ